MFEITVGVIGMVIGFLMIIYARPIIDFAGRIGWVEEYLGPARSYSFFKFLGLVVIILSLLLATGVLYEFLRKLITYFGRILMLS